MSEWVKCSDRMPEPNTACLAYATESGYSYEIISAFYGDLYPIKGKKPQNEFSECCNCSGYERDSMYITNVTHWMPFPKPPEDL